jgi:hypothetical protein
LAAWHALRSGHDQRHSPTTLLAERTGFHSRENTDPRARTGLPVSIQHDGEGHLALAKLSTVELLDVGVQTERSQEGPEHAWGAPHLALAVLDGGAVEDGVALVPWHVAQAVDVHGPVERAADCRRRLERLCGAVAHDALCGRAE